MKAIHLQTASRLPAHHITCVGRPDICILAFSKCGCWHHDEADLHCVQAPRKRQQQHAEHDAEMEEADLLMNLATMAEAQVRGHASVFDSPGRG
jgi:hypothetical protein